MGRPSETVTAAIGTIVGAGLIVGGAFFDLSKITPEVAGALVALISWIAFGVTLIVAAKQRKGELTSAADGSVVGRQG